jgi:hypothetical protein
MTDFYIINIIFYKKIDQIWKQIIFKKKRELYFFRRNEYAGLYILYDICTLGLPVTNLCVVNKWLPLQ